MSAALAAVVPSASALATSVAAKTCFMASPPANECSLKLRRALVKSCGLPASSRFFAILAVTEWAKITLVSTGAMGHRWLMPSQERRGRTRRPRNDRALRDHHGPTRGHVRAADGNLPAQGARSHRPALPRADRIVPLRGAGDRRSRG